MRERKITIHTTSDGQTTIVYDLVDPKDGGLVTRRSATLKTFHAIDYPGLFYNIKKLITDDDKTFKE